MPKAEKTKSLPVPDRSGDIAKIIRPIRLPCDTVNIRIHEIEEHLRILTKGYGLEIKPDFQRQRDEWTRQQQIAYIENLIRGATGLTGRIISFNCPQFKGYGNMDHSDIPQMVCIDGVQRLNAIRDFIARRFKVFPALDPENGGVDYDFFNHTAFSLDRIGNGLVFQFFNMEYLRDVLDFYIAFNKGGTPHSDEEIARVIAQRDQLPEPPLPA